MNTYDNFTLNSIFRPEKYALQYQLHSLCSTILYLLLSICLRIATNTRWMNRDYVVDIEVHVFFLIKAFGRNIELRVKLSSVFNIVPYEI